MPNAKGVVIRGTAALLQKPEKYSGQADEVLYGMTLEILQDEGQWLFVKTHYSYNGYIDRDAVMTDVSGAWEQEDKHFIISSFADVMTEPRFSAGNRLAIPRGSLIALAGEEQGQWIKIAMPTGETGWIRKEALQKKENLAGAALRQAIVDTALLYLGTQYRWGGKSPMGIDCSGLSSMAYMLNGITIPRDSEDQMEFMRKVERKHSKPGDLLFFPGHVAIYIGEDKFVHATGAEAVTRINSLNKDSKLYRKDLDEKYICTGTVL